MGKIDKNTISNTNINTQAKSKQSKIEGKEETAMEGSWTSRLQILSLMAEQTIPRWALIKPQPLQP